MGDVHPAASKALLCEKLSAITFERWNLGLAKTTLCNSGFEAVEVAMKTSLLHSGKSGVIAFRNGYHGLGYGALESSLESLGSVSRSGLNFATTLHWFLIHPVFAVRLAERRVIGSKARVFPIALRPALSRLKTRSLKPSASGRSGASLWNRVRAAAER